MVIVEAAEKEVSGKPEWTKKGEGVEKSAERSYKAKTSNHPPKGVKGSWGKTGMEHSHCARGTLSKTLRYEGE